MGQEGRGSVGYTGGTGEPLTSPKASPVFFGQQRPHAENWSVSWQEDVVTEPSDQGRPGPGMLAFRCS